MINPEFELSKFYNYFYKPHLLLEMHLPLFNLSYHSFLKYFIIPTIIIL